MSKAGFEGRKRAQGKCWGLCSWAVRTGLQIALGTHGPSFRSGSSQERVPTCLPRPWPRPPAQLRRPLSPN